ncbi:MAG: hypothetical protein AAF753_11840 [Pseudomonadota bacterium]
MATHNERLKLIAAFLNAMAIGLVGFSLLRPLVDDMSAMGLSTLWWCLVAFAIHSAALYILGMLEKEVTDDSL